MDIPGFDVFEIDLIDARAVLHVVSHARFGDDVFQRQAGIGREERGAVGGTGKFAPRRAAEALGVDGAHALDDLEQPRPPGDAQRLEGGRDGQADGLFRAAFIGHDEMGVHRVQIAFDALDRSIEGF